MNTNIIITCLFVYENAALTFNVYISMPIIFICLKFPDSSSSFIGFID